MLSFYERNTQIFKKLIDGEQGVWLIDYEQPGSPIFVSYDDMQTMESVPVPEGYAADETLSEKRLKTLEKRLRILAPLICDSRYIFDKKARAEKVHDISMETGISVRTLQKHYYIYLAQGENGICPAAKKRSKSKLTDTQRNCRWAINKYFFSSRKMSLKETYYMMLSAKYTDDNGSLYDEIPSFSQFKYFYYKKSNPVKKVITQKGLSFYQRNNRPLYGKSTNGREEAIGCFEMDATIADIYLVSKYDRNQPIGRPVIYLAIDVATQLVAGVYVGFKEGEESVMRCLHNAAEDKVVFCKKYGIEIEPEQWPSKGLPSVIISDRGKEFLGSRTSELCRQFDIECVGLPPYRPDLKGSVEKTFDILQSHYKPLLKRKGVIEENFQERGAPDYRLEAALNLYEFTQVMIHSIIFYNSARIQNGYIRTPEMADEDVQPISSELWNWYHRHGKENLIQISDNDCRYLFLPRAEGKLSRKGLEFKQLRYYNTDYNSRCALAGIQGAEYVTVAYDPMDVNKIYLFEKGEYMPFELAKSSDAFQGLSYREVFEFLKREKEQKKSLVKQETQKKIDFINSVQEISKSIDKDELSPKDSLQKMDNIKKLECEEFEE